MKYEIIGIVKVRVNFDIDGIESEHDAEKLALAKINELFPDNMRTRIYDHNITAMKIEGDDVIA